MQLDFSICYVQNKLRLLVSANFILYLWKKILCISTQIAFDRIFSVLNCTDFLLQISQINNDVAIFHQANREVAQLKNLNCYMNQENVASLGSCDKDSHGPVCLSIGILQMERKFCQKLMCAYQIIHKQSILSRGANCNLDMLCHLILGKFSVYRLILCSN